MAMKMVLGVATMRAGIGLPGDIPLAISNATILTSEDVYVVRNTAENNLGVVRSYQNIYENTSAEIICLLHDDVILRERGWDERIYREFEDQSVGLCGMGGARWHGTSDLFKRPYVLQNLRRGDYIGNADDAHVHGSRFTEATDVAVLDGYCLVVRRSLLDRIRGWSLAIENNIDFLCYDYFLSAMIRRLHYRIRVVGIRAHHRGGQTSLGVDRHEEYEHSHRWFYETFRDCMPYSVR